MTRILVTGGLGFMGSNFVRHLVERHPEDVVTVFDSLSYAGRLENLREVESKVKVLVKDLRKKGEVEAAVRCSELIFHFAAETHIDRSIKDPRPFLSSNIVGTFNLLEAARRSEVKKIVYVSSSEVYGTALRSPMDEEHPLNPQSPYAATKVAADRMMYAYYETYRMPVLIVRPFNNYGPRQFPEKLIPHFILRALHDLPLPVYGDGHYSRDYLYVFDFCEAMERAMSVPAKGEVVNVATGQDLEVIEIAKMILARLNKSQNLIKHVADRPGHVRRLIGSYEKAKILLGWRPTTSFAEGLKKTIDWYLANEWWWKPLSNQFTG